MYSESSFIREHALLVLVLIYILLGPCCFRPLLSRAHTRGIFGAPIWLAFSGFCSLLRPHCKPVPPRCPMGPLPTLLREHSLLSGTIRTTTTQPPPRLSRSPSFRTLSS